jgi:hypothetical protein
LIVNQTCEILLSVIDNNRLCIIACQGKLHKILLIFDSQVYIYCHWICLEYRNTPVLVNWNVCEVLRSCSAPYFSIECFYKQKIVLYSIGSWGVNLKDAWWAYWKKLAVLFDFNIVLDNFINLKVRKCALNRI